MASPALEVQTRACEYTASFEHEAIRPHLFEHMPALDEATYSGSEPVAPPPPPPLPPQNTYINRQMRDCVFVARRIVDDRLWEHRLLTVKTTQGNPCAQCHRTSASVCVF